METTKSSFYIRNLVNHSFPQKFQSPIFPFYPSAWSRTCWNDQIPVALAQALGAGAVPGSAVWLWLPCPFAGQFLGVPAVPHRAVLIWWTPTLPFSSALQPPLTSVARLVLPQVCTEFTLPQHQGNAGFIYAGFGVCSDKDPFIWELLWCQEMWQLP